MPTSKLSTFVIDCQTDDFDAAARFWAAALRRELEPVVPEHERYRSLVLAERAARDAAEGRAREPRAPRHRE